MYRLSARSLTRLEGVDHRLVSVVKRAIEIAVIDFGVSEGLRSIERQRELLKVGATKTLKSKHIVGKAADLISYVDGRVSWELAPCCLTAESIRKAAIELDVPIRWGAAWHLGDIRNYDGDMEDLVEEYVDLRRSQGRKPFIDAPHFEIGY